MMDDMMLPERSVCPRPDAGKDNVGDICFACRGYNCNCEEEMERDFRGIGPPVVAGVGGGGDAGGAGG